MEYFSDRAHQVVNLDLIDYGITVYMYITG